MSQPTDDQIRAAVRELSLSLSDVSEHLSDEDVQRVARRQLSAEEQPAVDSHLRDCVVCARAVDDLRTWAAPSATLPFRRLALAAAVVLAVTIPAALWYTGVLHGERGFSPSDRQAASVGRDFSRVEGLEALDPADRARVTAALDAGAASLPAVLRDLRPPREVTLGPSSPAPAFDVISPAGTVTLSDRPQFTWKPLAGADGYTVTVFDEAAHVVQQGVLVRETTWTPERALPREMTLVWQVSAHRRQDTVTAPLSPAAPAKFRVLGTADAERLARLDAGPPQSHLVLGILYANAGVVDAAASHLEQVPAGDPHAAVARETLARLHSPSR